MNMNKSVVIGGRGSGVKGGSGRESLNGDGENKIKKKFKKKKNFKRKKNHLNNFRF